MDVNQLRKASGVRPVRFAVTGAKGAYARTLLAQASRVPAVEPSVLCDLDLPGLRVLCVELGYPEDRLVEIHDSAQLADAIADHRIALVDDLGLLAAAEADVLVEATGSPVHGLLAARRAIAAGQHVVMVSKEVDSVVGPVLVAEAREAGVGCVLAHGDQPANLIDLLAWCELVGLPVVAAGKAGEYDLIYDPEAGTLSQLDETVAVSAEQLRPLLTLGADISATLAARAELVAAFKRSAAADLCEMAAVASRTGLAADRERFHYPVARIDELADVYSPLSEGGLVRGRPCVDVFSALRIRGEASFAGGVFAVVETGDAVTWAALRGKGHVVSRSGRHACIYWPYHLMGVETIATILAVGRSGAPAAQLAAPTARLVLAGRAEAELHAGSKLVMGGHHHEIAGLAPVLIEREPAPGDPAPFYLAANTTLARDVQAGDLVGIADLDDPDPRLVDAWRASCLLH